MEALARRLAPRRYHAGQVVFHQGDAGAALYVIQSGRVKIALLSESGEELLLAILQEGDFFGELALLDGRPRSATASAITDVQAHTLGREEFLDFLRSAPGAAVAVCAALAERLRSADERLAESAFLDLPQRLGRRLLSLAESYGHKDAQGVILDLALSQRELASLVGATRQSVNKVLAQWQQAGILRLQRRALVILHPERLPDPLL